MRTTVRLNDALLSQAKREAAKRHQTLTSLIEQGLRLVLAESRSPRKKRRHVVLLTSGAGGLQPGVDLDNNAALLDIMEHPLILPAARISTNPRVFKQPSRIETVAGFASCLVDQPHCQLIVPGHRHWNIFVDLCRVANASGNLVQDAWLAALAIESGCELISTDRDFARFDGLRWRPPF